MGSGGAATATTTSPAPASTNGPSGLAPSVEAIKALVDQCGVEQVVQLAGLFGK